MMFCWNVNKILEHFGIILLNKPFSTRTAHESKTIQTICRQILIKGIICTKTNKFHFPLSKYNLIVSMFFRR